MTTEHVRQRLEDAYAVPGSAASRRLACLLGGAIGDALGYRVEFLDWAAIEWKYGAGGITLAAATGELVVSDDTQMTLFTLEGMARAAERGTPIIEEIRQAYLDWNRTQRGRSTVAERQTDVGLLRHDVLWQAQAPGTTCLSALRAGGQGSVDIPINGSKGCGGVMRTAPIGFLGDQVDDASVYGLGADSAALTHGHPDGYAPAGVMALAVRQLIDGASWEAVVEAGLTALKVHPAATGTRQLLTEVGADLKLAAGARAASARASGSSGQGWVGDEALAVGLHAAATAESSSEAIEVAANHDGDSDSTASIAGQLFGAKHGLAVLPNDAVYRVDALEALLDLYQEWEHVNESIRG